MPPEHRWISDEGLNTSANQFYLGSGYWIVDGIFKLGDPPEILGTIVLTVGINVVRYINVSSMNYN